MKFDQFTVLLLLPGPTAPADDENSVAVQDAHLAHLADLHSAGQLLAAGPMRGPEPRTVHGLVVLAVAPDEAERLMAADPAVRAGWFAPVVQPWFVPAGAVAFSPTRFPRSIAEARAD